MKANESQHHELGRPEVKEVIPSLVNNNNIKAEWLVASAVDDIYALEDSE